MCFLFTLRRHGRVCFFFFQAEDGIRDVAVTGVQTCALPIYVFSSAQRPPIFSGCFGAAPASQCWLKRSEERRVGKSVDLGGRRIIKKKKKKKLRERNYKKYIYKQMKDELKTMTSTRTM